MAEIKVERKKRNLLPLLLGLLALLVIVWWFLSRSNVNSAAVAVSDTATVATGIVPATTTNDTAAGTLATGAAAGAAAGAIGGSALDDYATFVGNSAVERNEDEQHAYTAGGIRRLATVIEGMNPGAAARAQVDLMRQKADSLEITATGNDRHADMTRAAFTAAAEAMRALPGATGATDTTAPLSSVTRAAAAVTADRHLLEQKDQIQTFFDAARDALRAMGGAGAA